MEHGEGTSEGRFRLMLRVFVSPFARSVSQNADRKILELSGSIEIPSCDVMYSFSNNHGSGK